MAQEQISKQEPFVFNTKGLELKYLEVKGSNELKPHISTTITTNHEDLVNDVVTQKAMDSIMQQLKSRDIKLDFEHEALRGKDQTEKEINKTRIPLGKSVSFERKQSSVDVVWELNPDWKKFDAKGNVTYTFEELKNNIEKGFYDGTSIAFIPTEETYEQKNNGETIRKLNDMELINVAFTGNPINPKTSAGQVFMKSLEALDQKSHFDVGETLLYEDGSEAGKVTEVVSDGYIVNPQSGDKFYVAEEDTQKDASKKNEDNPQSYTEEKNNSQNDASVTEAQKGKLNKEDSKMTEEEQKNQSAQEQQVEAKGSEQKSEQKSETSEQKSEEKSEQKSENSELKSALNSITEEIKSLKSDLENLKSEVNKPVEKAKEQDVSNAEQKSEEKSEVAGEPLSLIS